MPKERRQSSLGLRRGPQKSNIPFRADDFGLGKRTGIAIDYVDRGSDEFESFAEVMKQADKWVPPGVKAKKRKSAAAPTVQSDEDDENGEMSMSMDLTESHRGSPLSYFTNKAKEIPPNSARKSARSSLAVPRVSDVDFDTVPSPSRSPILSKQLSMGNGLARSSLSNATHGRPASPDFPSAMELDSYGPPENEDDLNISPRRTSFTQLDMDNDDDDDENDAAEVEQETVPKSNFSRIDKGKARADPDEDNAAGMEDGIANTLGNIENGPVAEEDDGGQSLKVTRLESQKAVKPRSRTRKPRTPMPVPELSPDRDGLRRGKRHRYPPLEYWRQEKVVYGRRGSGITLVPQIKEIIRVPKEPPMPLGKHRRRRAFSRAKSKPPTNPEEGWDEKTVSTGIVVDFVTKEEVQRRIAWTSRMVDPKPAANSDWFFQKVFGDGDFIAAGQLVIPPKSRKPSKSTKDNTYVFYVIEGAVSLRIHQTDLIVATGGMFLVPRGNNYFIENISERNAKLFFTQARKVPITDDDNFPEHIANSLPPVRRSLDSVLSNVRSSSALAPPPSSKKNDTKPSADRKRAASMKV